MAAKLVRALLTIVIAIVAMVATPVPIRAATVGCAPDIGKRTPVILVHGWGSSGSIWGSTKDKTTKGTTAVMVSAIYNLLPNMYVDIFDYGSTAREWVDNPNIGPRLAQRIACLAASSRAAGGLGKVIAIGHSMGGLAIRFAAAQTVNGRKVSQDIGFVVTIGTPNIGSGWANLGSALLPFLCRPEDQFYQPKIPPNSLCNIAALYGLKNNSQKIDELPWLPSNIPLLAIAGDVTITYPIFFVTVKIHTQADLFVSKKSALQGMAHPESGGGQFALPCTASARELDLVVHAIVDTVLPSCSHTVLPHNQDVVLATVNAIKKYLASIEFASYVGSWHVHGANLTINADWTGLEWWNLGPCTQSLSDTNLCSGNAKITFTLNRDGSIKGTVQSVWYTQGGGEPYTGTPAGAGYMQPGYFFNLKHVGSHLLSETWLNNPEAGGNSWWCDSSYDGYECGQ